MRAIAPGLKYLLPFVFLFFVTSCDRNDPQPSSENDHVNSWIYENMKDWYYWTSEIPADPDKSLAPNEFFNSLLTSGDRFSWIQENYIELLNSLRGVSKEDGFEFALYRVPPGENDVAGQILYIKPNSPASAAGLKRGDMFTQINGTQLTVQNYQDLLSKLSENHSLSVRHLDINTMTHGDLQTINLVPVEYAENPNYLNTVFTYGDRVIGYYVYNLFSNGPDSESKTYTNEMDNIFASFKSQNITDLIVDLRFNSGGAESAAQNLASLISNNLGPSTLFVKHEYNDQIETQIKADPTLGERILNVPFISKTQSVGGQLRDNRVYILTGSRTASASELIINSLKPFMDVYLVGNTTVGKNVGSISIYDDEDPDNKWGIQPIVVKLFNSQNQSDYANGFAPQTVNPDVSRSLYPLGDPRESLLKNALFLITGLGTFSRKAAPEPAGELLFHSLDLKKRSGVVTLE